MESPTTIESTLRRLTREGHTCAAVAKPSGPALSTGIAVIFSKPTPPSSAPPAAPAADVQVVTATADTVEAIEQELNAAAAQGYRPCGLTLTAPFWGRPSAYGVVAVLARTSAEPTGVGYRVVRSRARREDWARLERAAADGFVVSRVASWPAPTSRRRQHQRDRLRRREDRRRRSRPATSWPSPATARRWRRRSPRAWPTATARRRPGRRRSG